MVSINRHIGVVLFAGWVVMLSTTSGTARSTGAPQQAVAASEATPVAPRALLDRYCVSCHNEQLVESEDPAPSPLVAQLREIGLTLDTLDVSDVGLDVETWEKVAGKIRAGAMPPAGRPRPDATMTDQFLTRLEADLDTAWAARQDVGRRGIFHRLNRAEYANVIRDLLELEVDVSSLLPPDDASYGFDNIADALGVSPLLMERYLATARQVSRLAVGSLAIRPEIVSYLVPTDLAQNDHLDGLPLGTRGGIAIRHQFPLDGDYVFKVRLLRTVVDTIRGLGEPHEIEITIDGERVQLFTIGREPKESTPTDEVDELAIREEALAYSMNADAALEVRLPVKAGPRVVTVAFLKKTTAQIDGVNRPPIRTYIDPNETGGPPYIRNVSIDGPHDTSGPGQTPSRDRVFTCRPNSLEDEVFCAERVVTTVARRAYRRPITQADVEVLLDFYQAGRREGGFDDGIGRALQRILVSPEFLFRIERDPNEIAPNTAYALSDLELASRLSFFLWSSIPDDELLDIAERGELTDPAILEQQVRRMLRDSRSQALVNNFGGQWLYLRNVASAVPDPNEFPNFDQNLRSAIQRETELFFEDIIREDRSVRDFLTSNRTFLNERLARHYGVPNIYGSHFRPVTLSDSSRGGILGHASVLTATSYSNRTSPVLRGKWILENIIGAPPPPPPPNVPELEETEVGGEALSMRALMEQHRENPNCAVCHLQMDPLGLALENFDAVGRWRTRTESDELIDASGTLPDGTVFDGPEDLRNVLDNRIGEFITTFTDKLLVYAIGRGTELSDAPAIRQISNQAAASNYRFSSLIMGVVQSPQFTMRMSQP